jgi:hypothetical protein
VSVTLSVLRGNIRWLLNDTSPSDRVFSTPLVNRIIENELPIFSQRLGLQPEWVVPFITVAAGVADYVITPATGKTHGNIEVLRLNSTGWLPTRVTQEEMTAMRVAPPGGIPQGQTTAWTAWEGPDQVLRVRLYPIPAVADSIDAYRSALPATLTSDATVLPFNVDQQHAMEKWVGVCLLGRATEEDYGKLRLAPDYKSQLAAECEEAAKQSRARQLQNQRNSFITRMRG